MSEHTFSVSQVGTYDLCPRKWAFKYIDKIESPPGPAAALGVQVHEQLEEWLRDGKPLDLTTKAGRIAIVGLHLLPEPKTPGVMVEDTLCLDMGGHKWIGYKDVQILDRPIPLVMDHKTTGDFAWMKSEEDLHHDPQACLYAADAMVRTGAEACDLQWTYFRTRGAPVADLTRAQITRQDVTPVLSALCESADGMQTILDSGVKAREVLPNPRACGAFGGCEHVERCNLSEGQGAIAHMTQQIDFLAKLEARNSAINPPTIPSPAMPPSVPASSVRPPPPDLVFDETTKAWIVAPASVPVVAPPITVVPVPSVFAPAALPVAAPAELPVPTRKPRSRATILPPSSLPAPPSIDAPIPYSLAIPPPSSSAIVPSSALLPTSAIPETAGPPTRPYDGAPTADVLVTLFNQQATLLEQLSSVLAKSADILRSANELHRSAQ